MITRLSKLSIAAVVLIGVGLLFHWFGDAGGSVAFAEVLNKMRGNSYTFDFTYYVDEVAWKGTPIRGSVLEPGRMRMDCPTTPGLGPISSIMDAQSKKCLILFHPQKAAEILTNPIPNRNSGGGGFAAFISGPVKELWNLRDGTEKTLGKNIIDGIEVEGFQVHMEDEGDIPRDVPLQYDVQIWANAKTAEPVLVEIAMKAGDGSGEVVRMIMNHFQLDVQLDASLFQMEPPVGYILSHQKDLDEVIQETKDSPQGKILLEAITLAENKKMEEALKTLRTIDWGQPIAFGRSAYLISITEKQYITLKPDDQQKAMEKVMEDSATVRQIARALLEQARQHAETQSFDRAIKDLRIGQNLGKLLSDNPDGMIIVRLVGIAVQKLCLQEMVSIYETIDSVEKLEDVKAQLLAVQSLGDEIKKQATGK